MTLTHGTADFIAPEHWAPSGTERFTAHHDLRGLLAVEHPWEESTEGGFGAWEATVAAPAGWQPGQPLFLSFYQSDNYSGEYRENPWLGAQAFLGHRFKQLLVNGQLVWEADVADEEFTGVPEDFYTVKPGEPGFREPYRVVDISAHAAERMTLTFRVVDKIASTTMLPEDAYHRFSWSPHNPHEAMRKFQTSVYFGDVALAGEERIARPEEPQIAANPQGRAAAIPAEGILLNLVLPGELPAPGFPVRCGVPLPQGAVAAGKPFAICDEQGAIPAAVTETSHWPDGSVRWALCEFVAKAAGEYRLVPGEKPAPPAQPVRGKGRKISNGPLTLTLGEAKGPGVFNGLTCSGGPDLGAMDLSVKMNRVGWRDHFTARRRSQVVERASPVCATVRLDGDMLTEKGQRFGAWRARLHLWTGLPYLLMEWTLINESDQAMAMLLDWSANVTLPDLEDAVVDFGPFTPGYDPEDIAVKAMGHYGTVDDARALPLYKDAELSCRQERVDQARIFRYTTWIATTEQAAGYVNLRHPRGGFAAAMRWFAEEFPKGIKVRPELLTLATLPESVDALAWPHDRPTLRIGRGEAKRQTFALWLHDGSLPSEEAERFTACVNDAPHLFDADWFVNADVIEAGPSHTHPALAGWRDKVMPVVAWTGLNAPRLGHREYWDTCWSNDYRGRSHIGLLQYIETGDPRWRRYFEAAITHNRDVDVIHFCPEHPDWVGSCHEYGEDHTSCGPSHNISMNVDGMLDHYLLTGDPDSLEAARGFAERLLGCSFDRCARVVGWPLSQIMRWHGQTGDPRFLCKAVELVAAAFTYTEPRRGILAEIHGCWSYRGAVSFMNGYLAFGLIRYHQATGDAKVLSLLRKVADGLFAEIHPVPRRFRYSPFPENNVVPHARWHNALIGGLVGYLWYATGDAKYAEWAKECYDGLLDDDEQQATSMDMHQIAGWMLRAVAQL
ncbi:MAG: RIFT barrel domain-containing protein [Armatimonadota bacterium]